MPRASLQIAPTSKLSCQISVSSCSLTSHLFSLPLISRSADQRKQKSVKRRPGLVRAADDSDVPAFKGFPPMQTKPAFYWRMLAVVPYILPLCEGWLYSETAYNLHPALELYEELSEPFFELLGLLPGWFILAYFFATFLGIVRNNRWPHFVRFHFITGVLLEIFLQVVGTMNDWIPESLYWGRLSAHFWMAVTFAFLFTVIQCIICALKGCYADVPFVSDAAYIQIPYE